MVGLPPLLFASLGIEGEAWTPFTGWPAGEGMARFVYCTSSPVFVSTVVPVAFHIEDLIS
jgi:hypothetical protein